MCTDEGRTSKGNLHPLLVEDWRKRGAGGGDEQMCALMFAPLALPQRADALDKQGGTPRVCGGAPCLGLL